MKTIPVKTTYLEMTSPRELQTSAPLDHLEIKQTDRPAVDAYRSWYAMVGDDWNWVDRKLMSDQQLETIIHDPLVEIYLLQVDQQTAGYVELDRREQNQIEIAYFGLAKEFIGKGLGRYFLDWTLNKAWSYKPQRVWLHTCELDHPAALARYQQAGFKVIDRRVIEQRMM